MQPTTKHAAHVTRALLPSTLAAKDVCNSHFSIMRPKHCCWVTSGKTFAFMGKKYI